MTPQRIHLFVGISLLVHAMLAAIPLSQKRGDDVLAGAPSPLVVRLIEAAKPEPAVAPTPQPEPVPVPKTRPEPQKKVARAQPAPPTERPIETPTPAETPPRAEPQFDMLAMINARRERRTAAEEAMRRYEEAHSGNPLTGPSDPNAALNRNLQSLGSSGENTGGVFTILSKGTRTAEFAFNGWRPESNRRWREVIEVDAGPGGDVELAIVRRMIQLIRTHYTGDFIWRSHRLDKRIVLSARVEDSRDLEDFLLREFFGTPTLAKRH